MESRRRVPVDLAMLAIALQESSGEDRWHLDLESGDVFPVFDDPELVEKVESAPDRYLFIEAMPETRDDFRAMEDFVGGLAEGEAKRDLERVLRRAKPFRNFREALRDWPEARQQWFGAKEARAEETARAWLDENEIEAVPRPESA